MLLNNRRNWMLYCTQSHALPPPDHHHVTILALAEVIAILINLEKHIVVAKDSAGSLCFCHEEHVHNDVFGDRVVLEQPIEQPGRNLVIL